MTCSSSMEEGTPLLSSDPVDPPPDKGTRGKVICLVLFSILVVLGIIATVVAYFQPSETTVTPRAPNIVLIVADDVGWGDVGYNNPQIHTPTLDRLARDGVKLESYYTQPMCTPSRASLLSGKHVIHLGMQHNRIVTAYQPMGLPLEVPTLADSLRQLGYATHIVGKWDLGTFKKEYMPTYRGFDSFFGFLSSKEDYYTHEECITYGDDLECGLDLRDNEEVVWNNTDYSTNLFASKAQKVIQQHESSQPLFLYLSFQAAHMPLEVPSVYREFYKDVEDEHMQVYGGMVTCMDEAVANVTKTLQEQGLWENTVLVFISDNGGISAEGSSNGYLRGNKGELWEGGIRVPAFVHGPTLETTGVSWNGLVAVTDWYPTLVRMAGAELVSSMALDGHDVWQAISTGTGSPRTEILHNIDPLKEYKGDTLYTDSFNTQMRAAIRVGNWKLVTGNPEDDHHRPHPENITTTTPSSSELGKNVWLFDIEKDPRELQDVSTENPVLVRYLLDKLLAYNETAVPVVYPPVDEQSRPSLHGGVWSPWQ